MTAVHHDEHPVFAELVPPVDEDALAALLARAVADGTLHATYDHDDEGAIGE